jgi:hypothetical protein
MRRHSTEDREPVKARRRTTVTRKRQNAPKVLICSLGADRRFDIVCRDEVFVPLEAEVGYAIAAQCGDCCVLCRC